MSRLQIGYTNITPSHILKKEEPLVCVACQDPFTIKYILTNSSNLNSVHLKYDQTANLKQFFQNTDAF